MSRYVKQDTPLAQLIADTELDLAVMLPSARDKILRRIKAAYWIGANDGMGIDAEAAERRSESRTEPYTGEGYENDDPSVYAQ